MTPSTYAVTKMEGRLPRLHVTLTRLDGDGPAELTPLVIEVWPEEAGELVVGRRFSVSGWPEQLRLAPYARASR